MNTRALFAFLFALFSCVLCGTAATLTIHNAMSETAYLEVSGGGVSLAVRVPPAVTKTYSFNAVSGDVNVYLETGSFGGFLEAIGSVSPSGSVYALTLQGWGTTFDIEPNTLVTSPTLPSSTESRDVFVMGMVLAATIRVARAGIRWAKRAAADSSGSGE